MSTKLYVGNLPFQTTDQDLQELFGTIGEVASVNVVTDRATGRARGFAFVEMSDPEAAQRAGGAAAQHQPAPARPQLAARQHLPGEAHLLLVHPVVRAARVVAGQEQGKQLHVVAGGERADEPEHLARRQAPRGTGDLGADLGVGFRLGQLQDGGEDLRGQVASAARVEVAAEAAEKDLRTFLVLQLLHEKHLGDEFDGTVTGIMPNGTVFVSIDRYLVDGAIPSRDMKGGDGRIDRWNRDQRSGRLIASRSGASAAAWIGVPVGATRSTPSCIAMPPPANPP